MNISALAKAHHVSTDTVRYYEKQGLLQTPARQENGYRHYTEADSALLRFVRGAQALGFSLAEIRAIVPQWVQGKLDRPVIEHQLQTKMAQIDAHIHQLQSLKKELLATFASLKCPADTAVSAVGGTAPACSSASGLAADRNAFGPKRAKSGAA